MATVDEVLEAIRRRRSDAMVDVVVHWSPGARGLGPWCSATASTGKEEWFGERAADAASALDSLLTIVKGVATEDFCPASAGGKHNCFCGTPCSACGYEPEAWKARRAATLVPRRARKDRR